MPEFDEERFLADVNLPSDEQVERAARLVSLGQYGTPELWMNCKKEARAALLLHLNKAKWQIGLGS